MTDQLTRETVEPVVARARFDASGLLPAIIQQEGTKDVLMMGWMDAEALRRTLTEGRVTFWSRSRQEYWRKGDTSGHAQFVRAAALDCDDDVLLVTVEQIGAACHTGSHSCFEVDPLEPATASSSLPSGDTDPTGGLRG
ncbi:MULTISPECIES: phosphoribosyl-AMP cyclohydrolase [Frigoribacterium]|jgi:phosphoribosyl-AMP cyclohydrolase|uniref:phosphoribosyl-AMP cyclohydrolase n=1 Tax=Frigoribacterium TaxID=96492 RepID=UPI0006B8D93E|nr:MULTISPECIES: phosphoribosyl-AMP cyclohydrolase [Frigoribacterium]KPG84206.1 phosphoribosyl-AMP cyclohydrolase [Frigoribacterium sp. RIT-PI-h]KQM25153.1 phosphoribosyl-AMP cyclohydrolase [Frigoribacterium sp. Leaf8]MBD8138979.1 phosphoribosyl-AMP cyclohydrolase [Frigoribacterium sp. CFBP 13605]MBD8485623.1 phosphoribosyl-AMP cyclohydrolase [Frigoribacterium sp. CFBP 8759]OII27178.1 phosphoribosyl-AMP cyclohydrolase [Frigoribacterium sp. MCBA15_019]